MFENPDLLMFCRQIYLLFSTSLEPELLPFGTTMALWLHQVSLKSSFYENIFYVFSSDCNEAVNWMVSRWSQFHFRKLVQTSSNRFTNSRSQSTLWNYKLWGKLKMTQATCFLEITAQFSLWMEEQFIVTNQPNTQLCLLRNKMCFDVHSQQNSTPVTCLNKVYSEFVLTTN